MHTITIIMTAMMMMMAYTCTHMCVCVHRIDASVVAHRYENMCSDRANMKISKAINLYTHNTCCRCMHVSFYLLLVRSSLFACAAESMRLFYFIFVLFFSISASTIPHFAIIAIHSQPTNQPKCS